MANPRNGFFRRLCRVLKKEVTGHGPPDACLSGVIFVPRSNPVRQLPTNAMRLPRARAMRPVRHRQRREESAKEVARKVPDTPPNRPQRSNRPIPTSPARRVPAAEPNAVVLRSPKPRLRSPSPARTNDVIVLPPSPPSPPSPPPAPAPPTPPTILRHAIENTPPPPPSVGRHYGSPPPPPPLESPPSTPGSSYGGSERYTSPAQSRIDFHVTLDVDKAIIDIESDEDTTEPVGISATMSSGIRSIDQWMLSRSDGSTIKSDGTPSPTNTNSQHTAQRRRAWEVGKKAWTTSADATDEKLAAARAAHVQSSEGSDEWDGRGSIHEREESGESDDNSMHSARDEEEDHEVPLVPLTEPEPVVTEGSVQQRVQEWIRDGESSVVTREWRAKNSIQTSGLQHPLVQRHNAEDAPPSAKLYRAPARTREETEAQKRAREWVGATSVARRARAWDALADDAWEIEARRNRALPRTVNERAGRRARTDVHEVVGVGESELAHDDFIEFQTRPRRARGARILSNVSSLLGADNNEYDSEGDGIEDTDLDQQTLRTRRRPVASVLRRAKLLSRMS